jgi:hypothetical protein
MSITYAQLNNSFEDLRKAVADLNERHRLENPEEYE